MSEIKRYSKEWFLTQASNETKEAARKLKVGVDNKVEGKFDKNIFDGDKDSVKGWMELMPEKRMYELAEQYGGFDNLFALLDTDGDGQLDYSVDGKAIAAVDTPEDAFADDRNFTTKDLELVYKNIKDADEAESNINGNTTTYTFKDGSKVVVEHDDAGNIISCSSEKTSKNGEEKSVNITDSVKTEIKKDAQGRVIQTVIDAPGDVNDKTINTKYNSDKSKTVTTETAGRIITEEYDKNDVLISRTQELRYEINREIEPTNQWGIGECWLLSGINSLADTKQGQKIIKDSIKINPDGGVTVTLSGVGKSYTYSPEEIGGRTYPLEERNRNISMAIGDTDMRVLELAIMDYRLELLNKPQNEQPRELKSASKIDPLNGGSLDEAIFYLTGKRGAQTPDKEDIRAYINAKQKNPDLYASTVAFRNNDDTVGDGDNIITGHEYSISKIDDKYVYVRDPRDSYWEIPYPKEKFIENCFYASLVNLGS